MKIEVQKVINVHFIMKVSAIMILLRFFIISAAFAGEVKAQVLEQQVKLELNNSDIIESLQRIEQTSGVSFSFATQLLKESKKQFTINENLTLKDALVLLLADTGISYRVILGTIVLEGRHGQEPGSVKGIVVDEFGNPLPGATIKVLGTDKSTISDENGGYSFSLLPGNYTIEVSFMSFQTQRITDVMLKTNEEIQLNIAMKEDATALQEVVITQTFQKATASVEGLLLQQKNAAQFSDGISAEQIAKTPDNEVGSALKRITGVTTVDDKYVVVRSMGERWNQAVMDGVNLPSTDAYQQHFSFDIIPTALVESIVVSKTATPDMNANFAGGLIEVKTKDIPRENFTVLLSSTSHNSRSTFKDQVTKQRGGSDYFGFDDGTRDFPKGLQPLSIPVATDPAAAEPFLAQSRRFIQDNFTNYTTNTPLNSFYQFGIGRTYQLEGNNKWGFVGALNLRNTQSTQQIDHTERGRYMENTSFLPVNDNTNFSTLQQYGFKNSGANYTYNTTLGGMLNAGIKLGDHKLSMRNTYLHIYESQLTQITGWDHYSDSQTDILEGTILPRIQTTNYPIYQDFNQHKIDGSHRFNNIVLNWFMAYSNTSKDTKDATFMTAFQKNYGEDKLIYYNIVNSSNDFRRENYWNKESDINWGASLNWTFNKGSVKSDIKAGYFGSIKMAENKQERVALRILGEDGGTGGNRDIFMPTPELLNGSQYQWGGIGWEKINFYGNKYEGKVDLHAPFLMVDNKFGRQVRLVWGIRAESYVYTQIATQAQDAGAYLTEQLDDKKWQYMPAASLVISPIPELNIRLGYNKSIMRPQFSERLRIPYYDPVRNGLVLANWSGVISSVADNYDFKLEWFPSSGELLSLGVYHKNIKNPIEAINEIGNDGGSRYIHNMNSDSAKLWGIEIEVRKNLTFLGEGSILENMFISGNATFNDTKIISYVNLDGTGGTYSADRPLYGQTNYAYNLGIDYTGKRFSFSARHNASGDQYLLVGYDYNAEEIRMPYATTDAQVSWKFFKDRNLDIKFSVRNIFDSTYKTYNNINSYSKLQDFTIGDNPREQRGLGDGASKKFDEGIDRVMFRSWVGRTMTLSINYSF